MKKYEYNEYIIEVEGEEGLSETEIKKRVLDAFHAAKHSHTKDERSHECCICGKHFDEWGNDPWGSLNKDGKMIVWKDDDYCCDECNSKYVLSGRFYNAGISKEFIPVPEK